MLKFNGSLRVIIAITIILMGLQGLAMALISGNIYREHSITNHKKTIEKLVDIRTGQLLQELTDNAKELGLSQQQQPDFKTALKNKDKTSLEKILNSHFHRFFVTSGILKLEKLIILNRDFSFVAETTKNTTELKQGGMDCPVVINQAKQAKNADRLKIKSGLCEYNEKIYHMMIAPIGGLILKGYIVVVTDPINSLIKIENDLGMSLKFIYNSGNTVYKSDNWDTIKNNTDYLLTDFQLKSQNIKTNLHIEVVENIQPLFYEMPDIRTLIMTSASIMTLITIAIVLFIIHKTTLQPLNKITQQLALIRNNRNRLSDKIEIKGTHEIRQLSNSFNEMTSQLDALYQKMNRMAYTDQLTSLPNRHLFNEKLTRIIKDRETNDKGFALFMMDLNKFKPINDTLGHRIGDKVLQEVSRRLKEALRENGCFVHTDKDNINNIDKCTVARLGGDEFTAILTNIENTDDAIFIAKKIIQSMQVPFTIDHHSIKIEISIGIALYPDHASKEDELLHNADLAMYQAKGSEHHFTVFHKNMDG